MKKVNDKATKKAAAYVPPMQLDPPTQATVPDVMQKARAVRDMARAMASLAGALGTNVHVTISIN